MRSLRAPGASAWRAPVQCNTMPAQSEKLSPPPCSTQAVLLGRGRPRLIPPRRVQGLQARTSRGGELLTPKLKCTCLLLAEWLPPLAVCMQVRESALGVPAVLSLIGDRSGLTSLTDGGLRQWRKDTDPCWLQSSGAAPGYRCKLQPSRRPDGLRRTCWCAAPPRCSPRCLRGRSRLHTRCCSHGEGRYGGEGQPPHRGRHLGRCLCRRSSKGRQQGAVRALSRAAASPK